MIDNKEFQKIARPLIAKFIINLSKKAFDEYMTHFNTTDEYKRKREWARYKSYLKKNL